MMTARKPLPITAIVATRNEAANIGRCLNSLSPARRVVVIDSGSTDETCRIAEGYGAEVVQFRYSGGYPKKRQWAMDNLRVDTPWVFLLDADEVVSEGLWEEIEAALGNSPQASAFLVKKEFHFMGRRLRFGGFSHSAVLLFRTGRARFEEVLAEDPSGLDMEVHERLIVDGAIARLRCPLVHEDFKGLAAYIDRHNRYSTWEAAVRVVMLGGGTASNPGLQPTLFGNLQERRRLLKSIAIRIPFEPTAWFLYHYVLRLGFLEGRRGLIASQIRRSYIEQARAKVYEARENAGEG